jgi:hypothetical protein
MKQEQGKLAKATSKVNILVFVALKDGGKDRITDGTKRQCLLNMVLEHGIP